MNHETSKISTISYNLYIFLFHQKKREIPDGKKSQVKRNYFVSIKKSLIKLHMSVNTLFHHINAPGAIHLVKGVRGY